MMPPGISINSMPRGETGEDPSMYQNEVLTYENPVSSKRVTEGNAVGELDLSDIMRVQAQTFNADRSLKNQQIQQLWNTARFNQAVGELP